MPARLFYAADVIKQPVSLDRPGIVDHDFRIKIASAEWRIVWKRKVHGHFTVRRS